MIPEREMAFALSPAQVFSSRPFCESDYAQPARWRGPLLSSVDNILCLLPVLGSEIHRQLATDVTVFLRENPYLVGETTKVLMSWLRLYVL